MKQNDSSLTVILEPDVAKVFKTSAQVNKALRAILSAIPEKQKRESLRSKINNRKYFEVD